MNTSIQSPVLKIKLLGTALVAMGLLSGCLTPAQVAALDGSLGLDGSDKVGDVPSPTVGPSCFNERFVQPEAQISRSIDLLFVMDTSGSMSDNRAKVASGISAFVGELPAGVDYQIGVMLAHGSKSSWSGKLFKYAGASVFSSKTMTVSAIQTQLSNMVLNTPIDQSGEQGEEGSYSLIKGLTTNFAANQATGFFRADAALAVVFVSDENDICAPYSGLPSMPGLTSVENTIRNRDCKGGISTATVINQVKAIQGTRPYLFGAVTHEEIDYHDAEGNDGYGYGYGYMEIIRATNGISTEINNGCYTNGLSTMGKLATTKLNLILDYTLAHAGVDASTLKAHIDGKGVGMIYDPVANDIHLEDGGNALSVVDLNYCLVPPAPVAGNSGSGSGSGTATGGTSPTPGPTSTPTPTPTPTPVPTPTFIPPAA